MASAVTLDLTKSVPLNGQAPVPAPVAAASSGGVTLDMSKSIPLDAGQPSAVSRFGAGLKSTLPSLGTWAENKQTLEHPIQSLENTGKGMLESYKSGVRTAENRFAQPGLHNKILGAEEYLGSGIPYFGPGIVKGAEEGEKGNIAGELGIGIGLIGQAAAPEIAKVPAKVGAAIDESKGLGRAAIAERAAPRVEAAGNEVRTSLKTGLTNAEQRIAPLYENMHAADAADLKRTGAPGSINVTEATKALGDARKNLYGEAPASNAVNRSAETLGSYSTGNVPMADMQTARGLRSDLSDEIGTAINRGDRKTASALKSARDQLTSSMRDRAKQLGLEKDFDAADKQWKTVQDLREKVAPLTEQGDSAKLFKNYANASPETKNAITTLHNSGLIDKNRINSLSDLVNRVSRGEHPSNVPWRTRLAGYGGVGLGMYGLQAAGLVPKTPIDWLIRYGGGMGGAELGMNLANRIRAVRALEQLPEGQRLGTGLETVTPTTPIVPDEVIPPRATRPMAASRGAVPIEPMSDSAKLRMAVPLNMQPRPGEEPMLNMLTSLQQETQPRGQEAEGRLASDLAKQGEKARVRARVADAMEKVKRASAQERTRAKFRQGEGTSASGLVSGEAPKSNPSQEMMSRSFESSRLGSVLANPKATPEETAYAKTVSEGEPQASVPKTSFESLDPQDKEWVSRWAKEIYNLPQALKDSEMEDLAKYGSKGTSLREKIAARHIQQGGGPAGNVEGPAGLGGATAENFRQRMSQGRTQRQRDFGRMRERYETRERER